MKHTEQELKEIFLTDPMVKLLYDEMEKRAYSTPTLMLTGGAIVDILRGKTPKDYDFVKAEKRNFPKDIHFIRNSATADTYGLRGMEVQLLVKERVMFPYTVNQSYVSISSKCLSISIDDSFYDKILRPVSFKPKRAVECLMTYPKMRDKGFILPDLTYYSLVNATSQFQNIRTHS